MAIIPSLERGPGRSGSQRDPCTGKDRVVMDGRPTCIQWPLSPQWNEDWVAVDRSAPGMPVKTGCRGRQSGRHSMATFPSLERRPGGRGLLCDPCSSEDRDVMDGSRTCTRWQPSLYGNEDRIAVGRRATDVPVKPGGPGWPSGRHAMATIPFLGRRSGCSGSRWAPCSSEARILVDGSPTCAREQASLHWNEGRVAVDRSGARRRPPAVRVGSFASLRMTALEEPPRPPLPGGVLEEERPPAPLDDPCLLMAPQWSRASEASRGGTRLRVREYPKRKQEAQAS
jgi:hypothetical protein